MLAVNILVDNDKSLWAAKIDGGYVGCVKMDNYVCFTVEVFESALMAANKARNLQKNLKNGDNVKNSTENVKSPSKKPKKKVTYSQKLYTLGETQAMPLLRFQEVWVITKDDEYVRDCLDQKNKKLVSYTKDRDKAKFYSDHEVAKMNMRTLKNIVGPGFNLMRFFIENK